MARATASVRSKSAAPGVGTDPASLRWWHTIRRVGGVAVGERDQPALWALVRDAAMRAGLTVPRRVVLDGDAIVTAFYGKELRIGLPLIVALPARQLAAIIAHALVLGDDSDDGEVNRRYLLWMEAVRERVYAQAEGDEIEAWVDQQISAHGSIGDEVEMRADRAAAIAAGASEWAAAALVAESAVVWHFLWFKGQERRARRWLRGGRRVDLHDRWCDEVRSGIDDPAFDEDDAAVLAAVHVPLGGEISRLTAQSLRLERPVGTVVLNPLGPRERRRLRRLIGVR